jgi:hypothetical protein
VHIFKLAHISDTTRGYVLIFNSSMFIDVLIQTICRNFLKFKKFGISKILRLITDSECM